MKKLFLVLFASSVILTALASEKILNEVVFEDNFTQLSEKSYEDITSELPERTVEDAIMVNNEYNSEFSTFNISETSNRRLENIVEGKIDKNILKIFDHSNSSLLPELTVDYAVTSLTNSDSYLNGEKNISTSVKSRFEPEGNFRIEVIAVKKEFRS